MGEVRCERLGFIVCTSFLLLVYLIGRHFKEPSLGHIPLFFNGSNKTLLPSLAGLPSPSRRPAEHRTASEPNKVQGAPSSASHPREEPHPCIADLSDHTPPSASLPLSTTSLIPLTCSLTSNECVYHSLTYACPVSHTLTHTPAVYRPRCSLTRCVSTACPSSTSFPSSYSSQRSSPSSSL